MINTEKKVKEVESALKKTELITNDIQQFLQENQDIKTEIQEKLGKLHELETTLEYLKVLQYTNNLRLTIKPLEKICFLLLDFFQLSIAKRSIIEK